MRISDDRYSRDRRRYDLALRFIDFEARTNTIRAWTGLSDDRIRKLCRSYISDAGKTLPTRHRGKSPQQITFFTGSAQMRQEAAVLASVCYMLGVLSPIADGQAPNELAGVERGELLCDAFEAYRYLVPDAHISFEHAVLFLVALAQGDELCTRPCVRCTRLIVTDSYVGAAKRCFVCEDDFAEIEA